MISSPDLPTRIEAHARKRVERLKRERPVEALRSEPLYARTPRPLALLDRPDAWVGEVVFAIPPKGFLSDTPPSAEEAVRRARAFFDAGAAAVCVNVERNFHGGAIEHFAAVRAAFPESPLIMRDCLVDEYQLELARAEGADGVFIGIGDLAERAAALGLTAVLPGRVEWRING